MTTAGEKFDRIRQTRAGGAVQRCHGMRHNGSYSNAEHTWGVLVLLQHLYPDQFAEIAPYALAHDVPEFIFGDIPAPTMRYVPGLRNQLGRYEDALNRELGNKPEGELSGEAHAILKSCDRLELWFWCREQLAAGNFFAREFLDELERYLTSGGLHETADLWWRATRNMSVVPRQAGVAERIVSKVEEGGGVSE